ncbi:MAG: hypothetical protein DRO67_01225 [Candidatus Asgardarchaeum californiense]|nr:MAG: hypothetical protein DRO67_01225 [Candidatus Asgardarchaeum californiense]
MSKKKALRVVWLCVVMMISVSILFGVSIANSSTIEVQWTVGTGEFTFFRIYDMNNSIVADNISSDARSYTIETIDACNSWYMVSVLQMPDDRLIESDRSNAAPWCPEPPTDPVPPTPGTLQITFTGTGTVTPVQ